MSDGSKHFVCNASSAAPVSQQLPYDECQYEVFNSAPQHKPTPDKQ